MFKLNPDTEELDNIGSWKPKTLVSYDLDFTASVSEGVTISLDEEVQQLVLARLYVDADPGAGFAAWGTYSFFNKTAKTGEDVFYRSDTKLVYTELEVATTGSDANITPDDQTDFSPNDLIIFLDDDEMARLKTIADTMVAENNVGSHVINTGVSKVSELHDVLLWNAESGKDVYFVFDFVVAQTVSLKLDVVLMKRG